MRVCIVIITLLMAQVVAAQNLVPNPGFEEINKCPFSWATVSNDFRLPGWSSATEGTPDYFNTCSKSDANVPNNWAGKAEAHGGNGYAGIYVWGKNDKSYREYIQCKLSAPLQPGKDYVVSFYYKLSSYSKYKTDRVGLLLIDSVLKLTRNKVFRVQPTLSVVKTPVEEGAEWDYASMLYKAKGGEDHLVIGNFFDDHNTENIRLDYREGRSSMLTQIAYFYIDDVGVVLADSAAEKQKAIPPPVVTQNEIYSLNNIQFATNSYVAGDVSMPTLDRLVTIMKEKPLWNVELVGHTDDVGTPSYNLILSKSRAANVSEYLQAKGITATRITTSGAGETMLLASGTDEMSRTINRRVEVQFVERQLEK